MTITPQNILRVTVGLIITAAILFLVWYFSSVVIYILVSAVLAIVGRPLVNWLARQHIGRFQMPRWAAASLTLMVIMSVFMAIFSLFIPLIFGKINEFTHLDFTSVLASVEQPIEHAQKYLQHTFALPETHFSLTDTLVDALFSLMQRYIVLFGGTSREIRHRERLYSAVIERLYALHQRVVYAL
jgi:predicted PurR-regulated permease PerM